MPANTLFSWNARALIIELKIKLFEISIKKIATIIENQIEIICEF